MAASPWPMPGVSTMTRSKPAAWQASITSASASGTSAADERVASDRKNTCGGSIAFMRMRSPSSAPPPLRRVGSTASTAMRSLSSWSSRKRRISSSVSDDLPEPPVPVMPSTGAALAVAADGELGGPPRPATAGLDGGDHAGQHLRRRRVQARRARSAPRRRGRRRTRRTSWLTIPARPRRWPSSGEKIGDAVGCASSAISDGDDDAAAAAVDPDVAAALVAQAVDEVAEVLDVAALVRADGHALHVLGHRSLRRPRRPSGCARGGSPRRPGSAGCAA